MKRKSNKAKNSPKNIVIALIKLILLACKDGRKVYNDLLHIRIVYFEIYKLYNKKGTDGVDGT